jgi:hypothetical protein
MFFSGWTQKVHLATFAFRCKRRHFCPSFHAKRCILFGEFACSNILKNVPHRHFVFSISKIIMIYFLFDRTLLKELAELDGKCSPAITKMHKAKKIL